VRARTVLLGTGGGPTMYKYHTPSGDKSMDGLAMAYRLGLPLRDMEMVQFHPTGLLAGDDTRMNGTVLEEGLRGAGGHLLNSTGERFMFAYDPHGERATRDLVSRAIYEEMRQGRATPKGGVHIKMSHLDPAEVRRRFPGMVKRCADCGFDLAGGLVEVVPTAHYFMGGVVCDAEAGTEIPGLFVAGEDAGGVHGANRLGGNGVANSTVYGAVAGDVMAEYASRERVLNDPDQAVIDAAIADALRPFGRPAAPVHPLRERLMQEMWDNVGVIRTGALLETGLRGLAAIEQELGAVGLGQATRAFNPTWHDWLSLKSLVEVSRLIAVAALARDNSRGAHFREDCPDEGDLETSYYTVMRRADSGPAITRDAVQFTHVRPGQSLIPEESGDMAAQ